MKTFEEVKEHLRNEAYFTDEVKSIKAFLRGAGFTQEQLEQLDFSKNCKCSYDFMNWFFDDVDDDRNENGDEPKYKVTIDGEEVKMTSDEIARALISCENVEISSDVYRKIISDCMEELQVRMNNLFNQESSID